MKKRTWISIFAIVASLLSNPAAHAAPIYAFTTAGASGASGPTQAQVTSAYSGTPLAGLVTINTQGLQEWRVPATGEYWIEFAGASGGYTPSALGGKGRIIKIKATLTSGNLIKILIGQEGGRGAFTTGYAGGGGGGTYIYNVSTSTYIGVAGGGGGAAQGNSSYVSTQAGLDAAVYTSTNGLQGGSYSGSYSAGGAGGTGGGGGGSTGGASGAGITTDGTTGAYGGIGGVKFLSGGTGGNNGIYDISTMTMTTNVPGGFGGGAGASFHTNYEAIGGGGGGYSGGGSGGTRIGAGGGGGNFYSGTYISSGLNTGNGYASIQLIAIPTVSLVTAGNVTTASKGLPLTLTATVDDAVKITFYVDNKRIPGCININASAGNVSCNWEPAVQKVVSIYAVISQAGSVVGSSSRISVRVAKRTGTR